MTQNDPHDALIILRYVSWGEIFGELVSHHQRFYTSLLGLACHVSPFPRPPPPSFGGLERPPPPPCASQFSPCPSHGVCG